MLSTRFRTRPSRTTPGRRSAAKEELIKKLQTDAKRLQKEIGVQEEDLKYLERLGGFTGTALSGLTEKGPARQRGDPHAQQVHHGEPEHEVKGRGRASSVSSRPITRRPSSRRRQLAELSAGTSRVERDAVIVVQKLRPQAGTVRLGYLVNAASWWPQYRLRGAAADGPVRLEYLAAVVQQTGESWSGVRVTLSTARPSLDAAPPELIPLKMDVPGGGYAGPIDAH